MQYGITHLSIVPLRYEPSDPSELVSQVLYGECFKVIEQRKKWSKIRLQFDNYEGWIDNKQYVEILENTYKELNSRCLYIKLDKECKNVKKKKFYGYKKHFLFCSSD